MLREKQLAMRSKLAFFLMRHSITVTAGFSILQTAGFSKTQNQVLPFQNTVIRFPPMTYCAPKPGRQNLKSMCHAAYLSFWTRKPFQEYFGKIKTNWIEVVVIQLSPTGTLYTPFHTQQATVWNLYNVFWLRRSKVRKQSMYTTLLLKIVPQLCQHFLTG